MTCEKGSRPVRLPTMQAVSRPWPWSWPLFITCPPAFFPRHILCEARLLHQIPIQLEDPILFLQLCKLALDPSEPGNPCLTKIAIHALPCCDRCTTRTRMFGSLDASQGQQPLVCTWTTTTGLLMTWWRLRGSVSRYCSGVSATQSERSRMTALERTGSVTNAFIANLCIGWVLGKELRS